MISPTKTIPAYMSSVREKHAPTTTKEAQTCAQTVLNLNAYKMFRGYSKFNKYVVLVKIMRP